MILGIRVQSKKINSTLFCGRICLHFANLSPPPLNSGSLLCLLTFYTCVLSADDIKFFRNFFKTQIFIAIFGFDASKYKLAYM